MEGLLGIFSQHQVDLASIYGPFKEYPSFDEIIKVEYDRWMTTDEKQKEKLLKLLQQKQGQLSIDDWIVAMTSWGIPVDTIEQISGILKPDKIYYIIAEI